MESAEWTSSHAADVGSTYEVSGFESSIIIERPIGDVFAMPADVEHDAGWRREWVESKKTSAGPLSVGRAGTRVTIRYDANGRGLLMLLAPLFAKMSKRQLEGDFPRSRELMTGASTILDRRCVTLRLPR